MKLNAQAIRQILYSQSDVRDGRDIAAMFRYQEWGRSRPEIFVDEFLEAAENIEHHPRDTGSGP